MPDWKEDEQSLTEKHGEVDSTFVHSFIFHEKLIRLDRM